jgi:hypothetical protein
MRAYLLAGVDSYVVKMISRLLKNKSLPAEKWEHICLRCSQSETLVITYYHVLGFSL